MKRHRRFEFLAGEYLKKEGFEVEVTQGVADWGVDVFAVKNGLKYAVLQDQNQSAYDDGTLWCDALFRLSGSYDDL